jgi:hypothetical protein
MTPMLKRTVGDFWQPEDIHRHLCTVRKAQRRPCSAYEAEAATLFEAQRDLSLLSLLRSEEDLMDLLEFLLKMIVYPLPPEGEAARAVQIADGKRLEELRDELALVRQKLADAGESAPESLADDRERIESEIAAIMKRYHENPGETSAWRTKSRIQVNGGISSDRRSSRFARTRRARRCRNSRFAGARCGGRRRIGRRPEPPDGKFARIAGAAAGRAADCRLAARQRPLPAGSVGWRRTEGRAGKGATAPAGRPGSAVAKAGASGCRPRRVEDHIPAGTAGPQAPES